jgi:hypothetical protein
MSRLPLIGWMALEYAIPRPLNLEQYAEKNGDSTGQTERPEAHDPVSEVNP